MKSILLLLLLVSLSFLAGCQTIRVTQQSDIMTTVEQQVLPYLNTQLNKPRFQQRPIMLVKLKDGQIASEMDVLTHAVRQRIEADLLQQPGIVLYRASDDLLARHEVEQRHLCLARPELFLGIEIKSSISGDVLSLKMLDKQQNNRWVNGFGLEKSIALNDYDVSQRQQLKRDPWLAGLRESPYTVDGIDLMVKDLGQQLNCQLMKHASPSSIYIDVTKLPDNDGLKHLVSLLKNDLPLLTGATVIDSRAVDARNAQLTIRLGWVMINKREGRGRFSITLMPSNNHSSAHIGASAYLTGVNDLSPEAPAIEPDDYSAYRLNTPMIQLSGTISTEDKEYETEALPVIILDDVPHQQRTVVNHSDWSIRF